jgi:GNAT superfamily N-acetyltransferase
MNIMPIRKATINDLDQICSLLSQLGGYNGSEKFLGSKLHGLLNHPDYYLLVYDDEVKKQLLGLASLTIIQELGLERNTALITYLVVAEESRGTGIGKQLENACHDIALQRNCCRIQLHCSSTRLRAHQFYESLGYKEYPKFYLKAIG